MATETKKVKVRDMAPSKDAKGGGLTVEPPRQPVPPIKRNPASAT